MLIPSKFVSVEGGAQLATYERGAGQPIVMINGLGASTPHWGPTAELLAARARLIMFDHRGTGQSVASRGTFTLEQLAEDACTVLEAFNLSSAHWIGYSMGGMIAQIVAARRPELVDRLVLVSTHTGINSRLAAAPETRAIMQGLESLSPQQATRHRLEIGVAPGFIERDRATFDRMLEVFLEHLAPDQVWRQQWEAMMTSERADLVRTIRAPTLIIHGRDDSIVRFGNGEILRGHLPDAQFLALDHCGHMVNWEAPERVVAALARFLDL